MEVVHSVSGCYYTYILQCGGVLLFQGDAAVLFQVVRNVRNTSFAGHDVRHLLFIPSTQQSLYQLETGFENVSKLVAYELRDFNRAFFREFSWAWHDEYS